jgi:plastocyanin
LRYWAALFLPVLLGLAGCDLRLTTPDTMIEVPIRGTYVTDTVRVNRGTLVRWRNEDSLTHNLIGPYWNSPPLESGRTYTMRVHHAGLVTYRCTLHAGETAVLDVR